MRRVSAFLVALANGISDDLRDSVAPDKLQYEVEKELENQMLAHLVKSVGEYNNARLYTSDNVQQNAKRRQVLRYMGLVGEMWNKTEEVKGALTAGGLNLGEDVDFVVSSL